MRSIRNATCSVTLMALVAWTPPAWPQDHSHHAAPPDTVSKPAPRSRPQSAPRRATARATAPHHAAPRRALPHTVHHSRHAMAMTGMYGPYGFSREASGTAWQPDDATHQGIHVMKGAWMGMFHAMANLSYIDQQGPRGDRKVYSDNMAMVVAQRAWGAGTFGLRTMLSAEPATVGRDGYPLLLQTGETADGVTPLIDRQHPHDLFMELAASYSVARGNRSLFVYAGLPGEPALGPPAFMHRLTGAGNPLAPITHHWLDSSHITFGVVTAGAVVDRLKLEASAFRGREPDPERWNIESPQLDSHSFRLSFNPTSAWALQASHGRIESPEQLEPEVVQQRTTASAMVAGAWGGAHWEATLAWGRNRNRPGRTLDGVVGEAAAVIAERHLVFARGERAQKDELFLEPEPRAERAFHVAQWTGGYRYEFVRREHLALGVGALGTIAWVPRTLYDAYGRDPASGLVFLHAALR